MDRTKLKQEAKKIAFANKLNLWKPMMLIIAVSFIFGFFNGLLDIKDDSLMSYVMSLLLLFAIVPLSLTMIANTMLIINGQKPDLEKLIKKYYKIVALAFIAVFLLSLLVTLGYVLLIVPGIIISIMYSQVPFILADKGKTGMSVVGVLKESRTMMDGHKWEYFVLNLSFIGWELLSVLTLGVLFIWVMPYIQVTMTMYYNQLKVKNN